MLHFGTNNAESYTSREISDKLLKLKTFIGKSCPQYKTIFLTPIIRLDKAKANLKVKQVANHLLHLKIVVVDNRNIINCCICRRELHLKFSGTIQLAKIFCEFWKVKVKVKFWSVKNCSGISNIIQAPVHLLT